MNIRRIMVLAAVAVAIGGAGFSTAASAAEAADHTAYTVALSSDPDDDDEEEEEEDDAPSEPASSPSDSSSDLPGACEIGVGGVCGGLGSLAPNPVVGGAAAAACNFVGKKIFCSPAAWRPEL